MQVSEFLEKFLERWVVKAETAFIADCREFLKFYERDDVLKFALNRLIMDWPRKHGTPAIADIREACRAVMSDNRQTAKTPEQAADVVKLVEEVMRSSVGRKCCDSMAGGDLELLVMRKKRWPYDAEIAAMVDPKKMEGFVADCKMLADMPTRSEMMESLLGIGRHMYQRNAELKRKYGSEAEQGRAA